MRSFSPRRPIRLLALAAVLAAASVLAACGGGSGSKELRIDPKKADDLAHVALISESDLPGSGWSVSALDNFDPQQDATSDKCRKLQSGIDAAKEQAAKTRAGRAQKELERDVRNAPMPLDIQVTVEVFNDTKGLDDALKSFQKLVTGPDYVACLDEAFRSSVNDPKLSLTSKSISPLASAPNDGTAIGAELQFSLAQPRLDGTMRFEGYRWRTGNVVVSVSVSGPQEGFTKELVDAAVSKTIERINLAAGPKPPTAAPAATSRGGQPAAPTQRPSGTPLTRGSGGVMLADLDSYRYVVRMEGYGAPFADMTSLMEQTGQATPAASQSVALEVRGAYVKPDRAMMTIKLGTFTVDQTIVGKKQWTTALGSTEAEDVNPEPSDLSMAVIFWDEGLSEIVDKLSCSGTENVNAVSTRRCGIDQQTFDQVRGTLGGFFSDADSDIKDLTKFGLQVWVADPLAYPARLSIEMEGTDNSGKAFRLKVDMDVTDVNSGITIDAPKQ